MKIAYYSAYSLNLHNASANRMRYFLFELKKKINVDILFPLLPQVKNNRPLFWRLFREFFAGIELSFRLVFSKYKLVILSYPPYMTILTTALILSLLKRKFILDIRDPYPEVFFELNLISSSSLIGKILKSLTRFIFMKATGISTTSEGIKKIIESYKINKTVNLFFNGFDPEIFHPRSIEEKFSKFTLIYHGNMARLQNVDLVVEIARKCPDDIDIVVAGSGPEQEKVRQEKRIKYLGSLSYKDIAEVVTKSHIGLSFINENSTWPFPTKIFEYIGAGLPVITTPYTEVGRFLEENNLGYQFRNNELNKIMEMIIQLKSHYTINKPHLDFHRQKQAQKFSSFVDSVL